MFIEQKHYQLKWENILQQNIQWKNKNLNIFKITIDSKIIWFQYRIVHRIIATNKLLFHMNIRNNALCSFCKIHQETIIHLFFECENIINLWRRLELWFNENNSIILHFNLLNVLFLFDGCKYKAINICIVLIKIYIYKCRITNNV